MAFIDLPVTLVAMTNVPNPNAIPSLTSTAKTVREWWMDQIEVRLKFTIRGAIADFAPHGDYLSQLEGVHWWHVGGPLIGIYLWPEQPLVSDVNWGEAFGNKVAVAGSARLQDMSLAAPKIINHELGHVLGLPHEEGTFMRAEMEAVQPVQNVTSGQRRAMRRKARRIAAP